MESIFFLSVIVLIILVVLPIISLVTIRQLRNEVRALSHQVFFLSQRIDKQSSPPMTRKPAVEEKEAIIKEDECPKEEVIESVIPEIIIPDLETSAPAIEEKIVPEIITPIIEPSVKEVEKEIETTPLFIEEKKRSSSLFNQLWGENLLSKIGIITFVLGIAFFVKYAIDQNWINEVARAGIGLLIGGFVIGIAHKLRKQYDIFASILSGGGFAVFYITITLAFREYELIPQPVAFLLLIGVTIACVLLSLLYDKKELALFSLLGGFAAPFLVSTGNGNYIVLFSYILILNCGMIWITFRKDWKIIGIVSFILSQLVIWLWLYKEFTNEYSGASLFLLLFFIQFHILAIASHLKQTEQVTPFQAMIILWNNVSLFAGCLFIFRNYPAELKGVITIMPALLNAIALLTIFRHKTYNKNFLYLFIGIILSFVTLAIPIQLKGNVITLFWAAEMVILLFLWQRSRIYIFRYGFYGVTGLSLISYLIDLSKIHTYETFEGYNTFPILLNSFFITGIAILAAFAICYYLLGRWNKKEDRIYLFFQCILFLLAYLIPFFEINFQLKFRISYEIADTLRFIVLTNYTIIYLAIIVFLKKTWMAAHKDIQPLPVAILFFYSTIYMYFLSDLRVEIYRFNLLPAIWFLIHLISLPAVGYIIYSMSRMLIKKEFFHREQYIWLYTLLVVIITTFECDNLVIMLFGNRDNYYTILEGMHTFGYPILWGILAMILMIWGLKSKEIILRKISLVFFAFIIGKFYLYDVWRMSQGGRIISFVILGLILLLVSFMQQRIRKLVKEDQPNENERV